MKEIFLIKKHLNSQAPIGNGSLRQSWRAGVFFGSHGSALTNLAQRARGPLLNSGA